jgi:tRNA-2-methylthio-N6-dimethylallyladenosine synthase
MSEDGLENFVGATPFSRLLRAVAATGMDRIKFTTSFPRDFHTDIISAMDENESLCEWVHLPVQSGSDKVLREMRRGYTTSFYMGLVEKVRRSARRISLTTDLIVGFPGESDKDFEDTVQLVKDCEYEGAYIFKYSSRPGTPAQLLGETVSEPVKTERFLALERVQKEIQKRKYAGYVGRRLRVLVEKENGKFSGSLTGHSACQKVVNIDGPVNLLGKVLDVEIVEAKANCLIGKRLESY